CRSVPARAWAERVTVRSKGVRGSPFCARPLSPVFPRSSCAPFRTTSTKQIVRAGGSTTRSSRLPTPFVRCCPNFCDATHGAAGGSARTCSVRRRRGIDDLLQHAEDSAVSRNGNFEVAPADGYAAPPFRARRSRSSALFLRHGPRPRAGRLFVTET